MALGNPPRSGSEARSGQGGVPPSYKDGSSPWPGAGELLPSQFPSQVDVRTVKNLKMSSKGRIDLKI